MMIMIVIVIGLLRTNLSGLYRHRRGLGFTRSRLQGRKYNLRIAKLVFHAKESPFRTRDGVLGLVSSRSNSPDDAYSPAVWIPPNPGLPQDPLNLASMTMCPARRLSSALQGGFLLRILQSIFSEESYSASHLMPYPSAFALPLLRLPRVE